MGVWGVGGLVPLKILLKCTYLTDILHITLLSISSIRGSGSAETVHIYIRVITLLNP